MSQIYMLESTTAEKIPCTITTSGDPTGNDPQFAITTANDTQPTTWQTGEWVGTWNATTGDIQALTPLSGAGQTLDLTPGDYWLWARWDIGVETPVVQATKLLRVT